jgi:hypothetical protein
MEYSIASRIKCFTTLIPSLKDRNTPHLAPGCAQLLTTTMVSLTHIHAQPAGHGPYSASLQQGGGGRFSTWSISVLLPVLASILYPQSSSSLPQAQAVIMLDNSIVHNRSA